VTFLAVLAALLLFGVRGDVARAEDGTVAARVPTLATSSAAYARDLRRWFPREIRLPDPRRSSTVAVSPLNLCRRGDLDVQHQESTSIVVGSVGVGALPKELHVADESAGQYRIAAFGYVIPRGGRPIWAGEVTPPGRNVAARAGMPSLGFFATTRRLEHGGSLVLIVVGEPIATRAGAAGAAMILGSCVSDL